MNDLTFTTKQKISGVALEAFEICQVSYCDRQRQTFARVGRLCCVRVLALEGKGQVLVEQQYQAEPGADAAALAAFAQLINSDGLSLIADPFGAIIFSRLLTAQSQGRKVYVKELTGDAPCSATAMLRRMQDLEQRGYICRVPDPSDGRSKLVTITPDGNVSILRAVRELKAAGLNAKSDHAAGSQDLASKRSSAL